MTELEKAADAYDAAAKAASAAAKAADAARNAAYTRNTLLIYLAKAAEATAALDAAYVARDAAKAAIDAALVFTKQKKGNEMTEKRGTRLPEEWALPAQWRNWALLEFPFFPSRHVDIESDCFKDYWISVTGKGATKLDWFATWRNWIRKAVLKYGINHEQKKHSLTADAVNRIRTGRQDIRPADTQVREHVREEILIIDNDA